MVDDWQAGADELHELFEQAMEERADELVCAEEAWLMQSEEEQEQEGAGVGALAGAERAQNGGATAEAAEVQECGRPARLAVFTEMASCLATQVRYNTINME